MEEELAVGAIEDAGATFATGVGVCLPGVGVVRVAPFVGVAREAIASEGVDRVRHTSVTM